jgi:hypothetical protein
VFFEDTMIANKPPHSGSPTTWAGYAAQAMGIEDRPGHRLERDRRRLTFRVEPAYEPRDR